MGARPAASSHALSGLVAAAKALGASLELHRVLVGICEQSAAMLGADVAIVYLGSEGDGLRVEAAYGLGPDAIGQPLEPGSTNGLVVPLRWEGELRGVLSLGWRTEPALSTEQHELLDSFGELAAAACRNASAHQGLAVIARTDALTGCLNRAAFHDGLGRELARCERTGQLLSLAMVDLDSFKQVNERHGHQIGDEVLRRAGLALRDAVRPYDLVGRYGGDEFGVVAVDTAESEAREVAARAIDRVARSVAELELHDGSGGATAGVAEWRPGETAEELIRRADMALLRGKHEGERGVAVGALRSP